MKSRIIIAIGLLCLLATAGGLAIAPAYAQGERCFSETGQCISV